MKDMRGREACGEPRSAWLGCRVGDVGEDSRKVTETPPTGSADTLISR